MTVLRLTTSRTILGAATILLLACQSEPRATELRPAPKAEPIAWQRWSAEHFKRAQVEGRLVLLDLGANWCHWCHVMDEETYADPEVQAEIRDGFVAIRADQDSDPALSARFEDFGWPATILFDGDGQVLARLSGYIPKPRMLALLKAFRADPSPGPSAKGPPPAAASSEPRLSKDLHDELVTLYKARYDKAQGGWHGVHRWLDWGSVEYALERAWRDRDGEARGMARQTLDAQRIHLLDPVWGGVYQYSHGEAWTNPHFEKLTIFQAHNLRVFSRAASLMGRREDEDAARAIVGYLRSFMRSPEGGFYASQDADLVQGEHGGEYFSLPDEERRKRGIPRVAKELYSRETGLCIEALCAWFDHSGEAEALAEARAAAEWAVHERWDAERGFRHGAADRGGPFLEDQLAMARGLAALAELDGDPTWSLILKRLGRILLANYQSETGFTHIPKSMISALEPGVVRREDMIEVVRTLNNLHWRASDAAAKQALKSGAEAAMAWLAEPGRARQPRVAGVLLAELELGTPPPIIKIQIPKSKPEAALSMIRAARRLPGSLKIIERVEAEAGDDLPLAFLCQGTRCSAPVLDPKELAGSYQRFMASSEIEDSPGSSAIPGSKPGKETVRGE